MDRGFTMHAKPESFFRVFVCDPLTKFHDVFLKRFLSCWVLKDLPDDPGVTRTQHVSFRHANKVTNVKTCHKANCITPPTMI